MHDSAQEPLQLFTARLHEEYVPLMSENTWCLSIDAILYKYAIIYDFLMAIWPVMASTSRAS